MKTFHRYKKTVLIVSSVLFGALFLHLLWGYIYSNGKFVWLPGGSISIGMVGTAPDIMNPLSYGTGKVEEFMFNFLFRSLIHYNSDIGIYQGDLANCDLSDLKKVTCTLRDDAVWSDNSKITPEDVIATINAFKTSTSNPQIKKFLEKVTPEITGTGQVTLSTNENSPFMVEILAYPIIRSDVIDQIKNGRFKKENYVTSWPFTFGEIFEDQEYGFTRVTLEKNPNSQKTVWLDRLSFKFFPSISGLEKWIDTVTVIIPPKWQESIKTTARFKNLTYTNYEFFWLFFHTDKLSKEIRNLLHETLGSSFQGANLDIKNHTLLQSIFWDKSLTIVPNNTGALNIDQIMQHAGYKKKWVLLAETKNQETTYSGNIVYPKLQYFQNGWGNEILYSDDPNANILLNGQIPASTTSVKINDYTLQEYQTGSTNFWYRISIESGSIKPGKNTYTLTLTQKNGSILQETLTLYQTTDPDEMQKYKDTVQAELLATENTTEKIAERENKKNEQITQIEWLSDGIYYNQDLKPYTLNLAYLWWQNEMETYANFIEWELRKIGILINKNALAPEDIENMIKTGEKNYDMILIGVEAPGNIARIGRVFLSSEAGNGLNFSNIQSKNLDTSFEELRKTTDESWALAIEKKIVNYMNDMSFFLPISSPNHTVYIDRNIKWVLMPKVIPDITALAYVFDKVSIKDDYELSSEGKSFFGFFEWIRSHF